MVSRIARGAQPIDIPTTVGVMWVLFEGNALRIERHDMSATTALPTRQLRKTDLGTLLGVLRDQQSQKVDVVIPAPLLRSVGGSLEVAGLDPVTITPEVLDMEGFTPAVTMDPSGLYLPTRGADSHLADKLGIPLKYVRTMRDTHLDLFDANVNGWANHPSNKDRKFLVRLINGINPDDDTHSGILRAVLSDSYGFRDNIDTLMALVAGLRAAGLSGSNVTAASLSDDNLFVEVDVPEIAVMAPELLANYRSPFTGAVGADNPVVSAGLVFKNSETGGGALSVTPRLKVLVCQNGMQITKDSMRSIHIGSKLDEGQIAWKQDTRDAEDQLFTKRVRDAVTSFLTVDYVQGAVDGLTEAAGVKITKPTDTIEKVAKELRFSQSEQDLLMADFIAGGDVTAGGVLHAVTSAAQRITDVDRSYEFEGLGIRAMQIAAATV